MIVDSQVHIWAAHTPERPWPAYGFGREHGPEPLTAESLVAQMDAAGVDRAVLVPPSWEGDRNDLAIEAARAQPNRLAVMGRLGVTDPANARLLADWKARPGMLGVRLTFHTPEQRVWLTDGRCDWLWTVAEAAGVPIMVLPPDQLSAIDAIAERHPNLRLVIDHLAMTSSRRDAEAFASLDALYPLAKRPNIAVKASALPCYTSEPYPCAGIHGHIERVVDAFGPERVFWGTDLSRLPCSYREGVTLFTEALDFLSESDKALIMGQAICRWLDWPAP